MTNRPNTAITGTVPATRPGAQRKLKRIREAERDLRSQRDHARQVLIGTSQADGAGAARVFARLEAIRAETERLRMLHDRITEEFEA